MANVAKNAILRAKINDVLTDIMVKTTTSQVYVDDTTTLAAHLATLAAKADVTALQETVNKLGALAQKDKVSYADLETALAALIDGKAEASALTEEIARAKAAEEAAASAAQAAQADVNGIKTYIGTIPSTATSTDIVGYIQEKTSGIATDTALSDLQGEVDTIKGDYLKAADKTELSEAIAAEKTRAEGVESSLQTQINTIMNNPDTEGVINSISEFTQYITDHGEIAEGFRTDIDANAKAISDHETLAAQTYETKTDATAKYDELVEYVDTKAVQADWSQSDSTAPDYVKNRTHYHDSNITRLWTDHSMSSLVKEGTYGGFLPFLNPSNITFDTSLTYTLEYAGNVYTAVPSGSKLTFEDVVPASTALAEAGVSYTFVFDGGTLTVDDAYWTGTSGASVEDWKNATFSVYTGSEELKQLDEKFIPDTIARVTDLTALSGRVEAAEGKITTLEGIANGLGDMATKDIVSESDLSAELAEKVNASAQGNHSHANKAVLDEITAEDVAAWDAAEQNAKDHATGLNTAMNTRVLAVEEKAHEHTNKTVLDGITADVVTAWNAKGNIYYSASEPANMTANDLWVALID